MLQVLKISLILQPQTMRKTEWGKASKEVLKKTEKIKKYKFFELLKQ